MKFHDSEDKEGELYIFKILEPVNLDGPQRCYIVISLIPKKTSMDVLIPTNKGYC